MSVSRSQIRTSVGGWICDLPARDGSRDKARPSVTQRAVNWNELQNTPSIVNYLATFMDQELNRVGRFQLRHDESRIGPQQLSASAT